MELYGYYRSTSSYRVRIVLALKGLAYAAVPVNLLKGEQKDTAYLSVNPQARVPALLDQAQKAMIQSPAIIEYLEERYPETPLLPKDLFERARVRGLAALIACDVHPLHNVSVLNYLRQHHQCGEDDITAWINEWISQGLVAVEQLIGESGYCFGETSLADAYLIPQLYAARRFNVPLDAYPKILRVEALANAHPAFIAAHPQNQADSPD
ncbi:maleylacetoacetate isomerase [Iodobacter ciconiae]|uniref:Maleylacetoacetate isomerase n=1 Tax=Iodobacter ciconiae TaxID=2496266 RepID=A0A3S8ZUE4_9NEIS|nr:maleylacetoacetate isomerase [Iodobacter ciconiae]AZN37123.1 maleylacetoacetate isomerase [Iodobacter ciconiae]